MTRRTNRRVAQITAAGAGLALAMTWSMASAAAATDVDDVVDGIDDDGYYVERDAEASESAVDDLVDDLSTSDETVAVALLAEDVDGGAEDFAGEVFEELEDRDIEVETLYIITPSDLGARSSVHQDGDLGAALNQIGTGSIVAEIREVHTALVGGDLGSGAIDEQESIPSDTTNSDSSTASSDTTDAEPGSSGGSGVLPVLVVVAGGAALVWFVLRRKAGKRQHANLDRARKEAQEQLTAIGEAIYDLNDRLTISDRDDLKERFAEATAEFNDVGDGVKSATSGPQMADLHLRLDRLRWQISAIEADLDGRPAPPEPSVIPTPSAGRQTGPAGFPPGARRPERDSRRDTRSSRAATCFFDPTHRAATTSAWITVDNGREVEVRLCRSCAQLVERGERPDIRGIEVDGDRVPAPRAPGGYGGHGYDLPDVFDIRVDGMDRGLPIDIGRPARRRRGGGLGDILSGGLGGVILGGGRRGGGFDGLPRGSRSSSRRDTGASAGRSRDSGASAGRRR